MSNDSLTFTATKKGWRTVITVARETPDPMTGAASQQAVVTLIRNHRFGHLPVDGQYAWTATATWEGKTRRGHGPTREAAVADLH